MKNYFYLCATPEAFIASHLAPAEFGNYLSTGAKKRIRGQAIFFEVDPDKIDNLPQDYIREKLIPYKDGEPKRSVYLSIYRSLEKTPLDALRSLFLVTDDGKVLELHPANINKYEDNEIHLYQQINPITTRVASKLSPFEFIKFLTDTRKPVSAPKVFIAELKLNRLARDPNEPLHNLPYPNPDHLRDCLIRLMSSSERLTKTVIRNYAGELSYRTIKDGFFVGDQLEVLYYPFPSIEELEGKYYSWWRSALIHCF